MKKKRILSEKEIFYRNDYNRAHYDRIQFMVRKGEREEIRARAKKMGLSVNQYIYDMMKRGEQN